MTELLTAFGTILSVVVVQLIRDWRDGKSLFHRNGNDLGAKMNQLKQHFNDTTTQLLTEIRDNTKATNAKLEVFEKYGIKQLRD